MTLQEIQEQLAAAYEAYNEAKTSGADRALVEYYKTKVQISLQRFDLEVDSIRSKFVLTKTA